MKINSRMLMPMAFAALAAGSFAHAATIIIQTDTFEGMDTGGESGISASTSQEGLSGWKDVTSQYNATSVSTGANARSDQGGFGGTYGSATNSGIGVRVRSSTGAMTLDNAMRLTEIIASTVTISFDIKEVTENYFLSLQYSSDAAFTNPITIATFNGNNPGDIGVWRAKSYTLTDGSDGVEFSDTAYFMIRKINPAGSQVGVNSTFHTFDNIVISAEVIPEPSVSLLGGFGILSLLFRRR